MKKPYEIHNYLSFRKQQEHKQEKACPLFYGERAVLNSRFRILAARGMTLERKKELLLPQNGRRFLSATLTADRRIAVRHPLGILLFSGELLSAGMTVAVLPVGQTAGTAGAMCYLAESGRLAVSPHLRRTAPPANDPEACMALESEMQALDSFLHPESGVRVPELCQRIAEYAGCDVRIDAAAAPLLSDSAHDRAEMTAFLLCAFLILRRQGQDGADVSVLSSGGGVRIAVAGTPAAGRSDGGVPALPDDPVFASAAAKALPDGRFCFSRMFPIRT